MADSAGAVIALLQEPDHAIKYHALKQLNNSADHIWPEIAQSLQIIEELCDTDGFKHKDLAAAVASKVFYHLESLDDALKYALGSGKYFDLNSKNEYVETVVARCIDKYVELRVLNAESKEQVQIDQRLEQVVERMFTQCFNDGKFKQALGIALESRRLDKVRLAIEGSGDIESMLRYCLEICQTFISNPAFRQIVLKTLIQIYESQNVLDYPSICQCYLLLFDSKSIAKVLHMLINDQNDTDNHLIAFQIAFDLSEHENQPFLMKICADLPIADNKEFDKKFSGDEKEQKRAFNEHSQNVSNLRSILSGEKSIQLLLQFLFTKSEADVLVIKNIKDKLESRNSITHNAGVFAHALMYCGTTRDQFIRDNLEWLQRANNWNKFSAAASFGVIHKGHHKKSMELLAPYLPSGNSSSPYLEGGALYGLGIIHANRAGDKADYLLQFLKNPNAIVQHGACLGLGLNAMATQRSVSEDVEVDMFTELKEVLYQDSTVAGKAAAIAMGLVFLGSGAVKPVEELLRYAQDTAHDKIIRGCSLGISMCMMGTQDDSKPIVSQLLIDKEPMLRYGACYTLGLAYVCTGSNTAIKQLLHIAVSDVSNDVRRAAVISLGFVLANQPDKLPNVVALLSESFNPHVRYGAALAIGIACAGTGTQTAGFKMVKRLLKDRIDFVRQGALISMAMLLIQSNKTLEPYVDTFREDLKSICNAKMSDTMSLLGAILAQGILDAGGRNCTISLCSRGSSGHIRIASIVGMVLFTHYWFWYPCMHFIALCFKPTFIIALNKKLQMPKNFHLTSNCDPKLFAYPPKVKEDKEAKVVQEYKAELSISAKAKARAAKRMKDRMNIDTDEAQATNVELETNLEVDDGGEKDMDVDNKEEAEQLPFEILDNPSRVTPRQEKYIILDENQRYRPITSRKCGIILLKDLEPEKEEELLIQERPKTVGVGEDGDEPPPPEAFEFTR